MKRLFLKSIVSTCTIGVFVFALSLCCCTQASASASTPKENKNLPACHQQKSKAHDPAKADCTCLFAKHIQGESITKLFIEPPNLVVLTFIVDHALTSSRNIKQKFNLSYLNGPPGFSKDIPLYILHHSIRC